MFFPNTNVWIGGQPNNTSTISEKKGAVNIVFRVVAKKEFFVLLGYDVMRVVFLYDDVQMMMIVFSQSILWASARVPAGSVPPTQSQKKEVGTIAPWPQARVC